MNTKIDRIGHIEWELWQDVCKRLKETSLVTEADLKAPMSENKTKGQKLIRALIAWGDCRSNEIALRTANKLLTGCDPYVLTVVREWGRARRELNDLVDAAKVA